MRSFGVQRGLFLRFDRQTPAGKGSNLKIHPYQVAKAAEERKTA